MRNSKRVVVGGPLFILVVASAVSTSRGQGDPRDAKTKKNQDRHGRQANRDRERRRRRQDLSLDPMVAGQAQVKLALMLIKGQKILTRVSLRSTESWPASTEGGLSAVRSPRFRTTLWPQEVQLIFCTVGLRGRIWHAIRHTSA